MGNRIKIVFTDLDATLLNTDKKVSHRNYRCLQRLGGRGVVRVIATGRSAYSFEQVIPPDFPADYLIFSSGAGVLNLMTRELMFSAALKSEDVERISRTLINLKVDFMVHETVPDNHRFVYCQENKDNSDFNRRVAIYKDFAEHFLDVGAFPARSAQIIVIFTGDIRQFRLVENRLNGYQVTRTTSPLDGTSIWMEIYPEHVSKGSAAGWLCKSLKIDKKYSLGIGNDYNDISLLDFAANSVVVANAPAELRQRYKQTLSNDRDGFYHAVKESENYLNSFSK